MEVGTFWQYQELTDMLFLVMSLALLLLLPLLGLFSTFRNFLFTEKKSSQRAEDFALLLGRFMAPRIFSLFVFFLNILLGASLVFILLLKYHYLSWAMTPIEILAFIAFLALGVSAIIVWRRLNFTIWSALFMSQKEELLLLRDYGLIAYVRALYQLILFFVAFLPLDRSFVLWGFILGFSAFILLRLFSTIKLLSANIGNWFSVFLYLCTCELLPWIYVLLAIEHIYRHNYLVLLFEYL